MISPHSGTSAAELGLVTQYGNYGYLIKRVAH